MLELKDSEFCKQPAPPSAINPLMINRDFEPKDAYANFKGNKNYGNRYDKRGRDSKYNKYGGGGYDKRRGGNKGEFARKELTEEEKKMKEEASKVKAKMEERNKLANTIELNVKLILNRITPNNYSSCKKSINKLIAENQYDNEVLAVIGQTIFNKACVEKKYTQLYSGLCTEINKYEAKHLRDVELSKTKAQRLEEEKVIFDDKLDKAKKEIEKGNCKDLPKELREFKPKIITDEKKLLNLMKKRTQFRTSVLERCRHHIEKLTEEFEVDKTDPDWEEKLAKHREKVIGNVRFIGCLFNADFMAIKLLMSIFKNHLIAHPKELIEKNEPLTNVAHDLVEACCILCESTGKAVEQAM